MRTKDQILKAARRHIRNEKDTDTAHLWLEVRKIEVLINIRDSIELRSCQLIDRVAALSKKD